LSHIVSLQVPFGIHLCSKDEEILAGRIQEINVGDTVIVE